MEMGFYKNLSLVQKSCKLNLFKTVKELIIAETYWRTGIIPYIRHNKVQEMIMASYDPRQLSETLHNIQLIDEKIIKTIFTPQFIKFMTTIADIKFTLTPYVSRTMEENEIPDKIINTAFHYYGKNVQPEINKIDEDNFIYKYPDFKLIMKRCNDRFVIYSGMKKWLDRMKLLKEFVSGGDILETIPVEEVMNQLEKPDNILFNDLTLQIILDLEPNKKNTLYDTIIEKLLSIIVKSSHPPDHRWYLYQLFTNVPSNRLDQLGLLDTFYAFLLKSETLLSFKEIVNPDKDVGGVLLYFLVMLRKTCSDKSLLQGKYRKELERIVSSLNESPTKTILKEILENKEMPGDRLFLQEEYGPTLDMIYPSFLSEFKKKK
jgi:hypothetical protein